jgi:hypothetical protein
MAMGDDDDDGRDDDDDGRDDGAMGRWATMEGRSSCTC